MNIAILKFSGKALDEFFVNKNWMNTISRLKDNHDGLVLVHGGGKSITQWSEALGLQASFINGQRVTSAEVMDVVAAVQSGLLNTKVVAHLNAQGFSAIGLTGIDRNLFVANYLSPELGYVGTPNSKSNGEWILDMLQENTIPVFSSLCRDKKGNLMNVNADVFTQKLAEVIKADAVYFISDINGVILNGNVKEYVCPCDIIKGISEGQITDGMIPKLNSCIDLLNKGINRVWIGSQNPEHLFHDNPYQGYNGTWIVQSA